MAKEQDDKKGYWQNELGSLGIEARAKNELNDKGELAALADNVKQSMYQDYKTAYGKDGEKHKAEARSTVNI